jgi:transducin (beta)-like 1
MAGVNIWNLPPTPPNADAAGPPGALAPAYMRTLSMSDMPDLTALDWSADGALLSVASYDNALRVLTADGREYMTHDMHKVRVFRAAGRRAHRAPRQQGPIFATRFSRDCKWLVTASLDGTACVWDVPGKRLEMLYKCHLGARPCSRACPRADGRAQTAASTATGSTTRSSRRAARTSS